MINTETNIINKLHYAWPVNAQEDKHQSNDHLNILMTFVIFAILS